MKKTYEKPTVKFELFTLTQNIAVNCGYVDEDYTGKPTYASKETCGWDNGYGKVYWTTIDTCGSEYDEDAIVGEVCYNNPNGMPTVFASK